MTKVNHALKMLIIIVSVFSIGYLLESFRNVSSVVGDYFEISTELLPLVLSFSIFVISWLAYSRSRDNHSLFLGGTFLFIGLLDLFHMLSYPFMPDFITPNSPQKSVIFWSEARLISAFLFLASVYVYKNTLPELINKSVLFAFVIFLPFILLITQLYYPENFLIFYYHDDIISPIKAFLLLITAAMILYTVFLYARRLRETEQKNIICLIYGFIIIIFGYMLYFSYNYSEHLLRAAGFYFIYLALYKSSIEQPYEKLAESKRMLLYEAEERYRSLFDNANDAIITIDLEDGITSWNRSAEEMLGWTAEEVTGKSFSSLLFPSHQQAESKRIIHNATQGGTISGIDMVSLNRDGAWIDVNVTISPLKDMNKNIIGLSCIIRDITERKRAEEEIKESLKEKEVLLREVHHRVKNNMQIISSLLKLQSQFIKDKKNMEIFKESQNRIISMSLIHEKLYQSRDMAKIDFNEYIRDMVNGLFQSYGVNADRIRLDINVENVFLGVDSAIPCGLIINELVTNCLKYAFPDGRKGEIKIILRSTDENEIDLIISDNGVGLPEDLDFRKTDSWGLHLVTILAENQLQGHIHLNRSGGTEFQIVFKGGK